MKTTGTHVMICENNQPSRTYPVAPKESALGLARKLAKGIPRGQGFVAIYAGDPATTECSPIRVVTR